MKKCSVGAAALASAAVGMVWAQQQPAMNARELFYSPPPGAQAQAPARSARAARGPAHRVKAVSPSPVSEAQPATEARRDDASTVSVVMANYSQVPLGLRYSVLKRGGDGQYQEVDPESVFHSGDKIRLNIETNDSAYLYIVMKGSSGKWLPLFPSRQISGGNNRIEKGRLYQIPPGDQGRFTFDENAGEEKLFLVLSRKPDEDFEKLVYAISSGGSGARGAEPTPASAAPSSGSQPLKVMMAENMPPINDDLISRIRSQFVARDLVFEKVDDATPGTKKEAAMYVVNPDRSPDARLVVDLKLKHQ